MTKPTPHDDPQARATTKAGPSRSTSQDLQAAYQCHTLAQLVFGRLATVYPWLAKPPHSMTASGWPEPPRSESSDR